MTLFEFIKMLHAFCHFQTREGKKHFEASNSELRRWITNKAVIVNSRAITDPNMPMDFEIQSFILFPKHPITLW